MQFGIPPETIKDSLTRFGSPPHIYVVPQQRFNLASGINVCEFEFATYFNFFVKGKPITLVCYPNQGEVLRKIADEIIEGPPDRELFYEVRLRVRVRVRVRVRGRGRGRVRVRVRVSASSRMMAEYEARSGSPRNSRSSMPSVMYLSTVRSEVQSSKRIA